MRSWLYRHPSLAFLLAGFAYLASCGFALHTAVNADGWWKLVAIGWAWIAWQTCDAAERFWRLT